MNDKVPLSRRPADATTASVILIGYGAYLIVGGAVGALVALAGSGSASTDHLVATVAWISVALATAICGYALLRRSRWARPIGRVLMLAWATYLLGSGLWTMLSPLFGESGHGRSLPLLKVAYVFNSIFFAAPALLAVWLLGRERVRRWCESRPTSA